MQNLNLRYMNNGNVQDFAKNLLSLTIPSISVHPPNSFLHNKLESSLTGEKFLNLNILVKNNFFG